MYLIHQTLLVVILLCTICAYSTTSNLSIGCSNRGATTDYLFSIKSQWEQNNIIPTARIYFPIQYHLATMYSQLQCLLFTSGLSSSSQKTKCWIQSSNQNYLTIAQLVVQLNTFNNPIFYIQLLNVINPNVSVSSYFTLCLQINNIPYQCHKQISKLYFTNPATISNKGISITTYPPQAYVTEWTTYFFTMQVSPLSTNIQTQKIKIRIKFPPEYTSKSSRCSLVKLNTNGSTSSSYQQTKTNFLISKPYIIECTQIINFFQYIKNNNNLQLKIENIINPSQANQWNNFQIYIIRQSTLEILQIIQFNNNITILPQNIIVNIQQSNLMLNNTNQYYFNLNQAIMIQNNSFIQIQIGNSNDGWIIHSARLIVGFTNPQNMKYTINGSKIQISNYGNASNSQQQSFAIKLTSATSSGDHNITVKTYIENNLVGLWSGTVYLNTTFGSLNELSFSAVRGSTKLSVNEIGPLELTFFLNYELPKSQDLQNGTLQILIYPQIEEPIDKINGVLKCYFKGNFQAAKCTFDNSNPNNTKITLISSPHHSFLRSQIPIIITTQGAQDTSKIGLKISQIVQRYRFQCNFYLYNSSTIPSEILYTTWIANAIPITTVATSLTHQCNQQTQIQINLTTPLLVTSKQYRVLVQFLDVSQGAWHSYLGYQADSLYKQYPCVIIGLPGDRIMCDLHTSIGTLNDKNKLHINSDASGPFFIVYGFTSIIATGTQITIQIPKVMIGNKPNVEAKLRISILEETPGELQPYVELYFNIVAVFTTKVDPILTSNLIPNSHATTELVQTSSQYMISWDPTNYANTAYILYQWINTQLSIQDTTSTACQGTNVCTGFKYPINWIVQKVTNPTGFTHTITTINNFVKSMQYLSAIQKQYKIQITNYNSLGDTLGKYNMPIKYSSQLLTNPQFVLLTSPLYTGLALKYSIKFTTPNVTTTSQPFIRLVLTSQLIFATPVICQSTILVPNNQSGIQCKIENQHTIIINNIKQIDPLTQYIIILKIKTKAAQYSANISPKMSIYVNYNYSINPSIVSFKQQITLQQAPLIPTLASPVKFTIDSPQIIHQQIRSGYVGPLQLSFTSNLADTYDITFKFANHQYNTGIWSTPNANDLDPLVCKHNQKRYICSPINLPSLQINLKQIPLIVGQNKFKINTQYLSPINGLKYPIKAGYYSIIIQLKNTLGVRTENSFFIYIYPEKLQQINAGSIVKNINTQSVYIVNFTIPSTMYPNEYDHATLYSRIFIEFPTQVENLPLFASNLGGYQGNIKQIVGCAFTSGTNYLAYKSLLKPLQCRLIPPQTPKSPVRVEIINHDKFSATATTVNVHIFKIFNPLQGHRSVWVNVRIQHVQRSSGNIQPLYFDRYEIFLDPYSQNTNLTEITESSGDKFFQNGKQVGKQGSIKLKSHLISGSTLTSPYYMIVKLPNMLPVASSQLEVAVKNCRTSSFQYCITAPQINYVLVKSFSNESIFLPNIKNYPNSISRVDTIFKSMIIQNGIYVGNIIYNIDAQNRWREIIGVITFTSCQAAEMQEKTKLKREKFNALVSFTTKNYIPASGTIQISWPTSVTKIYANCRSSISQGSTLQWSGGVSGEIGCNIQNGNKWVITSFKQVAQNSAIIISGLIDLPDATSIGMGSIITYGTYDATDVSRNGEIIDETTQNFQMNILNVPAMNVNPQIFMNNKDFIRINDVSQFRVLLQSDQIIKVEGNIKISMSKKDRLNNNNGFQKNNRKKVCQVIKMDSNKQIGCRVQNQIDDGSNIVYTLKIIEDLALANKYEIKLTTMDYVEPSGITYPSIAGLYKIAVTVQYNSIISNIKHQQIYLQIYGTSFTMAEIIQFNYQTSQQNLLWFYIQPKIQIPKEHQIILEFPTLSNNGQTVLFSQNLGLNQYSNGDLIQFDIFDSGSLDNSFMQCRIYHGYKVNSNPARIVCGAFKSALPITQILKFAISIINPIKLTVYSIPSSISLPILIYSLHPYQAKKIHFNCINAAVSTSNTGSKIVISSGHFKTKSYELQTENDQFQFAYGASKELIFGDSYVLRFNFPLRVNGKKSNQCAKTDNSIIGDAYYHQNLKIIVCKITQPGTILTATTTPIISSLKIKSFYTPWYYLQNYERKINAIVTHQSIGQSEVIQYTELFPYLLPKSTLLTSPSIFSFTTPHSVACQNTDYIFTIQLESTSAKQDLQYCKMIGIHFPDQSVIDYAIANSDCIEYPGSQIRISNCAIMNNTIYITLIQNNYRNDQKLMIQTRGNAIRNPCIKSQEANIISFFEVRFYAWENVPITKSLQYTYIIINGSNANTFTTSYVLQTIGISNHYFPFDWIETPNTLYYDQFPQFTSGQYSPFSFEIYLTTSLPTLTNVGQYHSITLNYGTEFQPQTINSQKDLTYNKPVCYLRNVRIHLCTIDTTTKTMKMQFKFEILKDTPIHVYFSIEDPKDPMLNGFEAKSSETDISRISIEIKSFGSAASILQSYPFQAKETYSTVQTKPQRTITSASIDYGTSIEAAINIIDINLQVTRTDIKGLKIQIPLKDELNNPIYSTTTDFFNIADGEQYPCGNNDVTLTTAPRCYILHGSIDAMGMPTSIIMTDFTYVNKIIRVRFIIMNPTIVDSYFSVHVKAYGGIQSQKSIFGRNYLGDWRFSNIFQTIASSTTVYTTTTVTNGATTFLAPSQGVWRDNTQWTINTATNTIQNGDYLIIEVLLTSSNEEICLANFVYGQDLSQDFLVFKSSTQKKAYFIKKWTASSWIIKYFKCKNYNNVIQQYYFNLNKNLVVQIDHQYSTTIFQKVPSINGITVNHLQILKGRAFISLDLSTVITPDLATNFKWQKHVNYHLNIIMTITNPIWTTITRCRVVAGFINYKNVQPKCSFSSNLDLTISQFNQLALNKYGKYIVEIDLQTNQQAGSITYSSYIFTVSLYGNQFAKNNSLQKIFSANSPSKTRLQQNYIGAYRSSCSSYPAVNWNYNSYSYISTSSSDQLQVQITSITPTITSLIAGTLRLQLKLKAKTDILFSSGVRQAYPVFRFVFYGYDLAFTGVNKVESIYKKAGTSSILIPHITDSTFSENQIKVQIQNKFGNIWGIQMSNKFAINDQISFDIQAPFTTTQTQLFQDKSWIYLVTFIQVNERYTQSQISSICSSLIHYFSSYSTKVIDEQIYQIDIFSSVILTSLSLDQGQKTQLSISFIIAAVAIGNSNKILLLQFNSPNHNFDYLKSTSLNHEIECQCVSGLVLTQNSVTSKAVCILRQSQDGFTNAAITVEVAVIVGENLICYFPGWVVPNTDFFLTAKLINKHQSYPPNPILPTQYGALFSSKSNVLTPITAGPLNNISIIQNPAFYNPTATVNSLFTSAYSLKINLGSYLNQPYVYLNMQKGGPIADSGFCTSTPASFQFCRIYDSYVNILVVKFTSGSINQLNFIKDSTDLSFPKSKQPDNGNEYDMICYIKDSSSNGYSYKATLTRSSANLNPSNVHFKVQPQLTSGSTYQSYTTNLILSFKLNGNQLPSSVYQQGAQIKITSTPNSIFNTAKLCTIMSINSPPIQLDCSISSNQLHLTNPYELSFSGSETIRLIIGITNPNTDVQFKIQGYSYYISTTSYGLMFESTTTYSVTKKTLALLSRDRLKMYPFTTRVQSNIKAPFRIGFKLSNNPLTMPDQISFSEPNDKILISGLSVFINTISYNCMLKQYSSDSITNQQTLRPNSFRSLLNRKQYLPMYTTCAVTTLGLEIKVPKISPITINYYYELIIMPVANTILQPGFTNQVDTQFRMLTLPDSSEYVGSIQLYQGRKFTLLSMYLVSTEPNVANALQLHFSTTFASTVQYPDHFFEIVFEDLNLNSIRSPYNNLGSQVPCTFTKFTAASNSNLKCIVNQLNNVHQTMVIRVIGLGNIIISNEYKISLDNFLLPNISSLLQQSQSFSICFRFWIITTSKHYQNCFRQLFVIDGQTNINATNLQNGNMIDVGQTNYGQKVDTLININYPLTSTSQFHQKVMIRLYGGYGSTTQNIIFVNYEQLWHNIQLNLYILKQPSQTIGTSTNINLNNINNPQPYQKSIYQDTNTISITYFNQYQQHTIFTIKQSQYSIFTKINSQIYCSSTYFQIDTTSNIAKNSLSISKIKLITQQTVPNLKIKKINRVVIQFDNVDFIQQCWVITEVTNTPYSSLASCSSNNKQAILENFHSSNTMDDLYIFLLMRINSPTLTYETKVYSDNGQLQYISSVTTNSQVISSSINPLPLLSFTQNIYTKYLYQHKITPLTITTTATNLYFSLYLSSSLEDHSQFIVSLPTSISPKNNAQTRLICQWLKIDLYGRKFYTGVYSVCNYLTPNIKIKYPYGGLPSLDGSNNRIPYLLIIRQLNVVTSSFNMPTTSTPVEIKFSVVHSSSTQQDTLIIYPYNHFSQLSVTQYTSTISQLNTYLVTFIPTTTLTLSQSVLQISLLAEYMIPDLGLTQLYNKYGHDVKNESSINYMDHNIQFDRLPKQWINGIPYTSHTLTGSSKTGVYISSQKIRICLMLQQVFTANTKYQWRIPLLKNPNKESIPFRMNLTLLNYVAGSAIAQKILFYQIINEIKTKPSISTQISYNLIDDNTIQTTNNSLDVSLNGYSILLGQHVELKLATHITGIININQFITISHTTDFQFYFFKRINLLIASRISTGSVINNLNFAKNFKSNQYVDYWGYDWIKIHSNMQTKRHSGSQYKQLLSVVDTVSSSTIVEGLQNTLGSSVLVQFKFTPSKIIPLNSTLVINYKSPYYQPIDNSYGTCYTNFKSPGCKFSNSELFIDIDQIISGREVVVKFYLKVSIGQITQTTTFTAYIYAIPKITYTTVLTIPTLRTMSTTKSETIWGASMTHIVIKPLYENTRMKLRGTFQPNHLTLATINIKNPLGNVVQTFRMIYRLNDTSKSYSAKFELDFIQPAQNVISTTQSTYTIPPNALYSYSIVKLQQYAFIIGDHSIKTDILMPTVGSVQNLQYLTESQIAHEQLYSVPQVEILQIINPVKAVGAKTALGFKFTVTTHNIEPEHQISLQIDTYNLMISLHEFNSTMIECVHKTPGVLAVGIQLPCKVKQYPTNTTPLILIIYPQKTVTANTLLQIWISPVINPNTIIVAGATIKLTKNCQGSQRCTLYEATGYYRTTDSLNITNYESNDTTFTSSNQSVQSQSVDHIFTFNSKDCETIFIVYPQNYQGIMPNSCSVTNANCLIFPEQRTIVINFITTSTALTTVTIQTLNNGIYAQPNSLYLDLRVISLIAMDLYTPVHLVFQTLKKTNTNDLITMTITPTQTPNIFLRGYMNTVEIVLKGLYSNKHISAFYISNPTDVVMWDSTYCNATLKSLLPNPYPTRLECNTITDSIIKILIPEGVNYQPTVTDNYQITLICSFFIKKFQVGKGILYVSQPTTSGNFNAYGSYSITSSNSRYKITQISTTIQISQHRVPILSKVQFNTQSFTQRLANIHEQTTFQILIDPKTQQIIDRIQVILPSQFGYPGILKQNKCQLITTLIDYLSQCILIRKNKQTIISIKLNQIYDGSPRILKIADTKQQNWFTAPNQPGNWYQMSILFYSANDTLLEHQTSSNCSQIGGLNLDATNIIVQNGRDALQHEIIDISFKLGSSDVFQGYSGSLLKGRFYTEIEIAFENHKAFLNTIGQNFYHGSLIGCVTNMAQKQQITCELDIGTTINDEPKIIIKGYQSISSMSNITIALANILNLPKDINNTLSIAVRIKKIGDNNWSYLYNPIKILLQPTNDIIINDNVIVQINYSPLRQVGKSCNLTLQLTPSLDINSYWVIHMPINTISNSYHKFQTQCSQCDKIEIFHRSNLFRIYPKTGIHLSSKKIIYQLINFPTSQYSIQISTWNITIQGYNNQFKQIQTKNYSIINIQMLPCSIQFGIISIQSPYTNQINVEYIFQFLLQSINTIQQKLYLILEFPNQYFNFHFSICNINFIGSYCIIKGKNSLLIGGINRSIQLRYQINITGITNPSVSNGTTFKIMSINQNQNIICQATTKYTFKVSPIRQCSLQMSLSHLTIRQPAQYSFTVVCTHPFRNSSTLMIAIPQQYTYNNVKQLECWSSNPTNILNSTCNIQYINISYWLVLNQININNNQIILTINVILNNALQFNKYNFALNMFINNQIYLKTNEFIINLQQGIPRIIKSLQIGNIPKNKGSKSYYIFRLSSIDIKQEIQIIFPILYQFYEQQIQIYLFETNLSSYHKIKNYEKLLQQINNFISIDYKIRKIASLQEIIIIKDIKITMNNTWCYFIINHIINPSYNAYNHQFSIKSLTNNHSLYSYYKGYVFIQLQQPASNIRMINYQVSNNDVLQLSTHKLTYQLSESLYINDLLLIVKPPNKNLLQNIHNVNCCLIVLKYNINDCHLCIIGKSFLSFQTNINLYTIQNNVNFTITISQLYNPSKQTYCQNDISDYMNSYFALQIYQNKRILIYESIINPIITQNPCIKFEVIKGDILLNIPSIIYIGSVNTITITLTRPTKHLKLKLTSNNIYINFKPNIIYFNSYSQLNNTTLLILQPYALNNITSQIYIQHQQSINSDLFRNNLPITITISNNKSQIVSIPNIDLYSIGLPLQIQIVLSQPSSNDMFLYLNPINVSSQLIFSSKQILIPAFSNISNFTIQYIGETIPENMNISLSLKSQYILTHKLQTNIIYIQFDISKSYQLIPPIMKISIQQIYKQNTNILNKTIYKIKQLSEIKQELKPKIITISNKIIQSTNVQLIITTQRQYTIYYLLLQIQQQQININNNQIILLTESEIISNINTKQIKSIRNVNNLINVEKEIKLQYLQHQTTYIIYTIAKNTFGYSNIIKHQFTTEILNNPIYLRLQMIIIYQQEIKIISILSQILEIQFSRIKIISSQYKNNKRYNKSQSSYLNQPTYPLEIVISPSNIKDDINPMSILLNKLINHKRNIQRLIQTIPQIVSNWEELVQKKPKKFYHTISRVQPYLKNAPVAIKISYYNANFSIKYWNKVKIHAILIEQRDKTPKNTLSFIKNKVKGALLPTNERKITSKQIIKGKSSRNLKAQYTYSGLTNDQGEGVISFTGLKAGSLYTMFTSASSSEVYEPKIYGKNNQITRTIFYTLWNPNMGDSSLFMLEDLKQYKPKLYNIIKKHKIRQKNYKLIQN